MSHDLIIRGGTVVDGTGAAQYQADIAVSEDRITEVGKVTGTAKREIDASGKIVTPGFVDIHTSSSISAMATMEVLPALLIRMSILPKVFKT